MFLHTKFNILEIWFPTNRRKKSRKGTTLPVTYFGRAVGKGFHSRSEAFALYGGHSPVVMIAHEVTVDPRLRKVPLR